MKRMRSILENDAVHNTLVSASIVIGIIATVAIPLSPLF